MYEHDDETERMHAISMEHLKTPAGKYCLLCFSDEMLQGGVFVPNNIERWGEEFVPYAICFPCVLHPNAHFMIEERLRAFLPGIVN